MTLIERKIFPDGVEVFGIRYNSATLQRLRREGVERVTLRFEPSADVMFIHKIQGRLNSRPSSPDDHRSSVNGPLRSDPGAPGLGPDDLRCFKIPGVTK